MVNMEAEEKMKKSKTEFFSNHVVTYAHRKKVINKCNMIRQLREKFLCTKIPR